MNFIYKNHFSAPRQIRQLIGRGSLDIDNKPTSGLGRCWENLAHITNPPVAWVGVVKT